MEANLHAKVLALRAHGLVFDRGCSLCGRGRLTVRMPLEGTDWEAGMHLDVYHSGTRLGCTNPACGSYDDLQKS
jgi:hypothetical protein